MSRTIAIFVALGVTYIIAPSPQDPKAATEALAAAPKSPASSKIDKEKDWQRTLRIFEAVGFGLICGTLFGYIVGRARSPKFDDPTDSPALIRMYVVEHCRFEPSLFSASISSIDDCVVRRDRKGVLDSIGPCGIYVFPCGIDAYTYDPKTSCIEKAPASLDQNSKVWRRPRRGFDFKETLAIIAGGAEGYSLKAAGNFLLEKSTGPAKDNESLRMLLFACLGAISGFAYGFWLGYDGEPKCGDKLFQQLLNDPVFWRGVAARHRKSLWWFFLRDGKGLHVIEGGIAAPSVIGLIDNQRVSQVKATTFAEIYERLSRVQADPGARVFDFPDRELTEVLTVIGESSMVEELLAQVGKVR